MLYIPLVIPVLFCVFVLLRVYINFYAAVTQAATAVNLRYIVICTQMTH